MSSGKSDKAAESFADYLRAAGLEEKSHQFEAVRWCVTREREGTHAGTRRCYGGLVADEMGLGKTAQVLSLIHTLRQMEGVEGPFLVVAPLSTLSNWSHEFAKWAPAMTVLTYKGPPAARSWRLDLDANSRGLFTLSSQCGGGPESDKKHKEVTEWALRRSWLRFTSSWR